MHAEQHQQAAPDPPRPGPVNRDSRRGDALHDRPHQRAIRMVWVVRMAAESNTVSDAITTRCRRTAERPFLVSLIFATQRRPGARWKRIEPSVVRPDLRLIRPLQRSATAGEQRTGART